MSKEQWLAAHEREVSDYLDRNPRASWEQAYVRTLDSTYSRMIEDIADRADALRQRAKDEGEAL